MFVFAMPGYATLQKGSKGEEVAALQERLIELGFLTGTADGAFGNMTKAALEAFQEMNGLDVNGTAATEDINVLFSDDAIWADGSSLNTSANNASAAITKSLAEVYTGRQLNSSDHALLSSVNEHINAILNTPTEISHTGTAYYVSPDGNDGLCGLSPEAAWATLDRVNNAGLQPGDVVFFERGGLWRGVLRTQEGVTYSAWGEGEKPKLFGSPENGADPSKWTLWHDENGVKIWKFHTQLGDPGCIIMNDGQYNAFRVYSLWRNRTAVVYNDMSVPFEIVPNLKYDLQFYCDYPENIQSYPSSFPAFDYDMRGDIYLRCDAGNPGEIYNSIEFLCTGEPNGYSGVILCYNNTTIDNLCVMYNNCVGISCHGDGIRIQNCEVAYAGGSSLFIGSDTIPVYTEAVRPGVPVAGEGIRMEGYGNSTVNCYVHDCFDGGIICEVQLCGGGPVYPWAEGREWGNIIIENNVVSRCMSGLLIAPHMSECHQAYIDEVTVRNNDILYSGYGWSGDERYDFTWRTAIYDGLALNFWYGDAPHGPWIFENNLLYLAKSALIHTGYTEETMPDFKGNVYVCSPDRPVIEGSTLSAGEQIEILGDSSGTYIE